jgi:two-component system chemotaxis response regulator CheY
MRALVIDDSKAMRMIVGRTLKGLGHEVVEACHGLDALERLKDSGIFEIALVDWNMPEMNGYEFISAVRADAAYKDMMLMMVTTEAEMSQVIKALEAGANEYIMKPFTKEMVQEKLQLLGLDSVD